MTHITFTPGHRTVSDLMETLATYDPDDVVDFVGGTQATRETALARLAELGWTGPTSYTKARLVDMICTLEEGGTIAIASKGATSSDGWTRTTVLDALARAGYDGPTSYTKARLVRMYSAFRASQALIAVAA